MTITADDIIKMFAKEKETPEKQYRDYKAFTVYVRGRGVMEGGSADESGKLPNTVQDLQRQ